MGTGFASAVRTDMQAPLPTNAWIHALSTLPALVFQRPCYVQFFVFDGG
jgi:hypothetical protein